MQNLLKHKYFTKNLIKKRNFFINVLILSSLAFVFSKNIEKIRFSSVKTNEGKVYILDRFTSRIELVK